MNRIEAEVKIMEGGCKVCGDKASGKHYGVPSCDGCRGFFKRSIRRKLDYVCKDKGECVVDVTRRNQCQACRFNKCLRVNMKRDAVQNERVNRERGSFSGCSSSVPCTTVHRSSLYSPLLSLPPPPPVVQSPTFHFSTHNVLGRLGLSYWSSSDNQVREDEVTSSQEAIQSHYLLRRCSSAGAGISGVSDTGLAETTATGLLMLDSADKLLSLSLASVRAIPSFQQLPGDVQRKLLEESWKDLFILTASQWQFNFADVVRKEQVNRETSDSLIRMTPDMDELIKSNLNKINRFVDRLRDLRPDHTEYACMKTLVLFKPEWCGEDDVQTRQVELVQEQTYQMLREYSGSISRTRSLVLVLLSLAALDEEVISSSYFHHSPLHRLHLL